MLKRGLPKDGMGMYRPKDNLPSSSASATTRTKVVTPHWSQEELLMATQGLALEDSHN